MTRNIISLLLFVVVIGLVVGMKPLCAAPPLDPVLIQLSLRSNSDHATIRIADVATLSGGDDALRTQIAALDLEDVPEGTDSVSIERYHVEMRIRIRGIEPHLFQVLGPAQTLVTIRRQPFSDTQVESAIGRALAETWQLPQESIMVRLKQPIASPHHDDLPHGPLRLEPFVNPRMQPGAMSVSLGLYANDRLVKTIAALVDVRVVTTVAVPAQIIHAGERLTANNVRFESRELNRNSFVRYATHADLDRIASRALAAGQPIDRQALANETDSASPTDSSSEDAGPAPASKGVERPGARSSDKAPAVPARSHVTVVYRSRGLEVKLLDAQLTKSTPIGEWTVAVNPLTGKRISGKLVAEDLLVIDRESR